MKFSLSTSFRERFHAGLKDVSDEEPLEVDRGKRCMCSRSSGVFPNLHWEKVEGQKKGQEEVGSWIELFRWSCGEFPGRGGCWRGLSEKGVRVVFPFDRGKRLFDRGKLRRKFGKVKKETVGLPKLRRQSGRRRFCTDQMSYTRNQIFKEKRKKKKMGKRFLWSSERSLAAGEGDTRQRQSVLGWSGVRQKQVSECRVGQMGLTGLEDVPAGTHAQPSILLGKVSRALWLNQVDSSDPVWFAPEPVWFVSESNGSFNPVFHLDQPGSSFNPEQFLNRCLRGSAASSLKGFMSLSRFTFDLCWSGLIPFLLVLSWMLMLLCVSAVRISFWYVVSFITSRIKDRKLVVDRSMEELVDKGCSNLLVVWSFRGWGSSLTRLASPFLSLAGSCTSVVFMLHGLSPKDHQNSTCIELKMFYWPLRMGFNYPMFPVALVRTFAMLFRTDFRFDFFLFGWSPSRLWFGAGSLCGGYPRPWFA